MIERQIVQCVVINNDESLCRRLFPLKVSCFEYEARRNEHYQAAINAAQANGCKGPFVVFDDRNKFGAEIISSLYLTSVSMDEAPTVESVFHWEPNPEHCIPDPDGRNDDRVDWAAQGLREFQSATGTDDEDMVADFLDDLLHYCDAKGLNFENELQRARGMYAEETVDEDVDEDEDVKEGQGGGMKL